MHASFLPPRPNKPADSVQARPFVALEAQPSHPGSAGSREPSPDGSSAGSRTPSPTWAADGRDGLLTPSASRRRRSDALEAWQEAVQRGRRSWLGEVRAWLQGCPQAAHASSFELNQDECGLPPLPPKLLAALARAEPAWEQLRLATLVSLLAGTFGDELAATAPPQRIVPAIMVTPPDGALDDKEVTLAMAQAIPARSEARQAQRLAAEHALERAYLDKMVVMLRLPFPRAPSPPVGSPRVAAPSTMPESLVRKFEQQRIAWKDIRAEELVAIALAMHQAD